MERECTLVELSVRGYVRVAAAAVDPAGRVTVLSVYPQVSEAVCGLALLSGTVTNPADEPKPVSKLKLPSVVKDGHVRSRYSAPGTS